MNKQKIMRSEAVGFYSHPASLTIFCFASRLLLKLINFKWNRKKHHIHSQNRLSVIFRLGCVAWLIFFLIFHSSLPPPPHRLHVTSTCFECSRRRPAEQFPNSFLRFSQQPFGLSSLSDSFPHRMCVGWDCFSVSVSDPKRRMY